MRECKDIVCENLVRLRKKFKMTQLELASQVHFSDKAISRWEKGEVIPDIPTLEKLANLYQVPISYFFEEHNPNEEIKTMTSNIILIEVLTSLALWTLLIILFILNVFSKSWLLWILAIPINCILILLFNKRFHKNRVASLVVGTILNWTAITFVYLLLTTENKWALFLTGVPIQGIILTIFFMKKNLSKYKK